jgi:type II secretory pathway pseudopilin PulG
MNRSLRRQSGLTLLEIIIGLGILGSVYVGANQMIQYYNDSARAVNTAQHMNVFAQGAKKYLQDNYSSVAAVATATTPALIRVSTLNGAGNYLPSGYIPTNSYGQTVCALVLQPTAGNLTAMVVAEGGKSINDIDLGQLVGAIQNAGGGGIYSKTPTTMTGVLGGWSSPVGNYANANQAGVNCSGAAGPVSFAAGHPVMSLSFAGGDTTSGVLYRNAIPGQPQLNQMNTPIVMNSTQTEYTACSTNGAIAVDASGAVLSCQNLKWKKAGSSYWEDPVATYASLPACNSNTQYQTRIVQTPSVGSGPRPYTCDGAVWQPLAVNDAGNLVVPNNLTVTGNTTSGTVTSNGRLKTGEYLELGTVAVEGGACSPNGLVARDANGLLLSCQSGIWRSPSHTWIQTWINLPSSGGIDVRNYGVPSTATLVQITSCGAYATVDGIALAYNSMYATRGGDAASCASILLPNNGPHTFNVVTGDFSGFYVSGYM